MFLGLTLAADQHGLVICGLVAVVTVARRPRAALSFASGALLVVAVVFGAVWGLGGRHLWDNLVGVHLYHLRLAQGVGSQFWNTFTPWLYEHVYLFVGAGLAAALLGRARAEATTVTSGPSPLRIVRVLLLLIGRTSRSSWR